MQKLDTNALRVVAACNMQGDSAAADADATVELTVPMI